MLDVGWGGWDPELERDVVALVGDQFGRVEGYTAGGAGGGAGGSGLVVVVVVVVERAVGAV